MTVGNLIALRQTNIVRLFAYSSIAQGGYILAPLAVAGESARGARRGHRRHRHLPPHLRGDEPRRLRGDHRRRPQDALGRDLAATAACSSTRPGSPSLMSIFLFSLAGIPPLGGWFAKFVIFKALVEPGNHRGLRAGRHRRRQLVIALFYYARVAQHMWMQPPPDEDRTPVRVPPSLVGALALCTVVTLVLGVAPGLVGEIGDVAEIAVPNVFG